MDESKVALDISLQLSERLIELGYETLLTRTTDVFIELGHRCDIANDWGADVFVSVHLNSNGPSAVGIETLYVSSNGKALAIPVQEALVYSTEDVDRGVKKRTDLYVLNGTEMPAILVEVGFISNPESEERFKSQAYLEIIVDAIASGLDIKLSPVEEE